MNANYQIDRVDAWKQALGLLAVPLEVGEERRFVMLNGSRGNFCLDLTGSADLSFARNTAWSADVGHYVSIAGDRVLVQRWDRSELDVAPYQREAVASDLPRFAQILERSDPDREKSIVRFMTRVYGQLRHTIAKHGSGGESLSAFLVLIASAYDEVPRGEIDLAKWSLAPEAQASALGIADDKWNALKSEMLFGYGADALRPSMKYLLRHTSGQIFQSAHYMAEIPDDQQLLLTGFLPQPTRGRKSAMTTGEGVFFTPPYLARTLVEQALRDTDSSSDITVFDPACGSGEILREVVRQLEGRAFSSRLRLLGWDISPVACSMARFVLAWERLTSKLSIEFDIEVRDSLSDQAAWPKSPTAIIMNPPFVSCENLNVERQSALANILGPLRGQRSDMAAGFLVKACDTIRAGGVVASILPASILDNDSARKIRKALAETMSPTLLAKLGDLTLFQDALVDAGIVVATKGDEHGGVMLWADHSKAAISSALRSLRRYQGSVVSQNTYSIYPREIDLALDSWAPRPYEAFKRFEVLRRSNRTVKDLFTVRQGVRTGFNPAFLLNDEQWANLPKGEQAFFRDAIINRSIQDGRIASTEHLFFPYGDHAIDDAAQLKSLVGTYADAYLRPHKETLQRRKKTDPNKWWLLQWPRTTENIAKIISVAFGRRGSYAFDADGKRSVLNGFAWYAKAPRTFDAFPENLALAYVAILNSALFDEILGATSRHVGGGQWDLQNRFVNDLPLPDLYRSDFPTSILGEITKIGEDLNSGKRIDEKAWAKAVEAAYQR